jgi:hypothetical protein
MIMASIAKLGFVIKGQTAPELGAAPRTRGRADGAPAGVRSRVWASEASAAALAAGGDHPDIALPQETKRPAVSIAIIRDGQLAWP